MAGIDATGGFNATDFRTAIQAAMEMGAPNDVSQQVTFIWTEKDTYSPEGPDDDPYSWTETPTAITFPGKTVVLLNVAVEFADGTLEGEGGLGAFNAAHATLTILDDDYAACAGADQVMIGGYLFTIDPPGAIPTGLFAVTVYQLHVSALG